MIFALSIGAAENSESDKAAQNEKAREMVRAALTAMGGEEKIRQLSSVTLEGIGHQFAVEQSERPEGPFILAYKQVKEIRDLANQRLRQTTEIKQTQVPNWSGSDLIVADGAAAFERNGRVFPGNIVAINNAEKQFALAPERIFLTALEAKDLRVEKDVLMQSINQHVIKFTWKNIPVTIYLNANTNLPTAVETLSASPYEHFWSIWGDFTTRTFYTYWTLEPGGIHYPHQWDVERNNYPYESFTIIDLKLNEAVNADSFKIPDDVRKAFAANKPVKIDDLPLGIQNRPAAEIESGIFKVPGRWDIAYVKQSDGIVIIEAPISSGYSAKVLEEAKKRYPKEKIKAVITTSDAFPHFGGVREYAAQSIPIYALDVNRPLLERVLAAPHKFYPDNFEKNPRKAKFTFVSNKTVIGDGANRMELYPMRTETGERMMMIYFPEHRLLYAADLIQRSNGRFFMPQYLSEAMSAVKRENLSIENVFAMHLDKTPWTDVTAEVAKQMSASFR
jgi:glyoxylase-like metal-dependent hydrolase (beta-lactamase superfamily II)